MRSVHVLFLVLLGTVLVLLSGSALRAQDKKKEGGPPPIPKPTKEHELLKEREGTWDCAVKSFMEPGKPPSESKGVEVNRMLGGLWLISDFKGDMMGQPFLGHGVTGYDPKKKKYTGVWV